MQDVHETNGVCGDAIAVTNGDGSGHVEDNWVVVYLKLLSLFPKFIVDVSYRKLHVCYYLPYVKR